MNLSCPHCHKPMAYLPKLAGHRVSCSSCKQLLLMPKLDALPPEIQEAYRQEVEEARRKQEADVRKKEEAELHRRQAERDAELRRQQAEWDDADQALRAEENRRQFEQIQLETERDARAEIEWKARVRAAVSEVPEEAAITNRYPALQAIANIVKVITVIAIVLIWCGIAAMWVLYVTSTTNQNGMSVMVAAGATVLAAFWSVLIWALGFAQAELILLAIDVSNDMRINRFLLKSIRYNSKT